MADDIRSRIIAEARARLGVPYGLPPGPGETDCSLYVRDVYEAAGVSFSPGVRVAEQERQDTVPIPWDQVLPGDLLFFEGTYDAGPPGADGHIASHIGISLGTGTHRMLNAVEPVSKETDISTPYWQAHIFEARRHPTLMAATVDDGEEPDDYPRGIDVSSHQGHIDWAAVAASGIVFAFNKFTEDEGYVNPFAAANWAGMKANGIVRGAYHFARPEVGDADDEARYFLDHVDAAGGLETGDMLVLDIEAGTGDLGDWTLEFVRSVEQRAGFKPIIYTGEWFSDPHELDQQPELAAYPLWLAAYQDTMPDPPEPWTKVAFWQYSDKGRVPGIQGNVDMNIFNGPADHLKLYGKPGAQGPAVGVPEQSADELGSLRNLVGVAYHDDGTIIPALIAAKASGDWSQVDAVVSFLKTNNPHKAA